VLHGLDRNAGWVGPASLEVLLGGFLGKGALGLRRPLYTRIWRKSEPVVYKESSRELWHEFAKMRSLNRHA